MYDCYENGIADNKKEAYSIPWMISENVLYLSTWFLAGWLLWPFQFRGYPAATIGWGILVVLIQIFLKKHNCSGCYYYGKSCHLGWGKLSSLMFPQNSGNPDTGKKLILFYIVSPPAILILSVTAGTLMTVDTTYWMLFGLFVVLNILAVTLRPKTCKSCAMRNVCPGSAAGEKNK